MRFRNKVGYFVIVVLLIFGCNLPYPTSTPPRPTIEVKNTTIVTDGSVTFPADKSFQADNGNSSLLFEDETIVRPEVDEGEINVHELNPQELSERVQDTPPPDGRKIIASLEITLDGMVFAPPAIVKFDVSERDDLKRGDVLEFYSFDEVKKEWELLGKADVDGEGFAVARILHTSIYAAMIKESTLTVTPPATKTLTAIPPTITLTTVPLPSSLTPIPAAFGKIVFSSSRNGTRELYTMDADGSGVTQLTFVGGNLDSNRADWSPDGSRIAFDSERGGSWEIYDMSSVPGSVAFNLTGSSGGFSPDWSPAEDLIAFNSSRDGDWEIYVTTTDIIDGLDVTKLTNNSARDACPDWSPNGSRIAFESDRDGNDEIYTMSVNGSGVVRLTNDFAKDKCPSWSPDGTQIAFISYRDGDDEIFIMNNDGSTVRQLTSGSSPGDASVSWSPDGNWITFQDNSDGDWEIYIMSIDGKVKIQLTNNSVYDANPDWRP